ncbi:hypothetical protein J7T55_006486 [Diaporthe amygdali]|uniref:uncharacterized protein n=1 Tax=Phomopsis amygdali TaxID=1214568 RepID=UPI0022FE9348|nr:uncharacterized protein J7T55_006486 [Diaporthe amygdali]KAJ0125142.1 hypothetical protein J7T55_006486 [Diaporthe amygdali]
MSGTGPDSMPTSADPRSKRPVKKRALSPASAQASQLDALFARPDQEIRVPTGGADPARRLPLPPEIVTNVQGSSAGAGSGEFHVYKAARRREYERLRVMDDEVRREADARDFAAKKADAERKDDDKTRRNREKREKMKARKEKAKTAAQKKGPGADAAAAATGGGGGGGGLKPRVDGASKQGEEGQDGKAAEHDSTNAGSGAGEANGVTATSAPGLVIHDDE